MSARNVGDLGSIPGLGRSPGEGNGNPLQYSCLENPMDGGAWWATVHGVAKSQTRLSDFTSLHFNSTQSLPHTEEKGLLQRTNPLSLLLFNNTVKVLANTIKKKKLKASTL